MAVLCAAGICSSPALAADGMKDGSSASNEAAPVEKVTVTATRQKRRVDEVPATVTVITAKDMEDGMATDAKDLVRFEPGVSVRTNPVRFSAALSGGGRDGNSGFNIRGIEGNRVLMQIDGVRIPDAFSFGPQVVGRGDYLDLDILKSVEILRGPASALYGSDGVAGAVSFVTKDPDDILGEGEIFAGRARVAYSSADQSWAEGFSAATQSASGEWQGLLAYTRRDAHETDNKGDNKSLTGSRTAPNPSDIESNSLFTKLVFVPDSLNRLRLTFEHFDRLMNTEAYSARTATVVDLDGKDEVRRDRVTLDHRWDGEGVVSSAFWAVYYQTSETREFSYEDRQPAVDRTREGLFDNAVWGATAQLESDFNLWGTPNSLVYGLEYSVTRQEGLRDGTVPTPPDFFPQKPFPDTEFTYLGAFLQDEISLLDGKLKLYPAVRFDAYDISPETSALYPLPVAGSSGEHVSPKIGAIYWPVDALGFFANYAEGFKAPAPSQVNNGFSNTALDYTSIPNPNLRPETSESLEAGIRWRHIALLGGMVSGSMTGFHAQYRDFIQNACVNANPAECTIDGVPPTTVFQYINIGTVEISGFESRADLAWENGLVLRAAFSSAEGTQDIAGVSSPLLTVDPWKIVTGLGYDDESGNFGGQAIVTHSSRKDGADIGATACGVATCFVPDAFTILDVTAYWHVSENAVVRAGVFNLFDEKYWWWGDVRADASTGLASTSTIKDAYTQPGRNASVSMVVSF